MSDDAFRWVITLAVSLACFALVAQAGIIFALYRMIGKMKEFTERAEPILNTASQIMTETRPRIAEFSSEAVEIARIAHKQAVQIGALLEETAERAKVRIAQIDQAVDRTVVQVEGVGDAVKGAVLKPVREANAVMAGLKAAVTTYAQGGRRPSVDHATQDEEMFI